MLSDKQQYTIIRKGETVGVCGDLELALYRGRLYVVAPWDVSRWGEECPHRFSPV